jgi:hypothetical protein
MVCHLEILGKNGVRILYKLLYKPAIQVQWPERLARLIALGKLGPHDRAAEALCEQELALRLTRDPSARFGMLPNLARIAFDAGAWDKAREYATQTLQQAADPAYAEENGLAVHDGHLVLGRLSRRDGDREQAEYHLLEAGRTQGYCTLNSFGPNMTLAKELLEDGGRDTVLEYFSRCSRFWKMGGERLRQWADDVRSGRMPDFEANLYY